ncbi:MAG: hypothetical protein JWP81_881 [Ferruginibacter sp.]|nr:hypothetical protein [Ferruginibacter sp.]
MEMDNKQTKGNKEFGSNTSCRSVFTTAATATVIFLVGGVTNWYAAVTEAYTALYSLVPLPEGCTIPCSNTAIPEHSRGSYSCGTLFRK